MTLDDFETWRVVYSQLVGAGSKYGSGFALNNVTEAQDSCKVTMDIGKEIRNYQLRLGQVQDKAVLGAILTTFF